jgi:hypothetical protein
MKKIILGLGLFTQVMIAQAQEVKTKLVVAKGEKFSITDVTKGENTAEFGGNEMKSTSEITTGQTIEVLSAEGGTITLSVTNLPLKMKLSGMMGEMEMNTADGSGFDQFGGMPESLKSAANFVFTLVIKDDGSLVSAKGFDKLTKPSDEEQGMINMLTGGVSLSDSGMIKSALRLFNYAKKGAYKVGETWNVTETDKARAGESVNLVSSIKNGEININVASNYKVESTGAGMMGGEATTKGKVKVDSEVTVNEKTGLLSKMVAKTKSDLTIVSDRGEIPVKNSAETVSEVKKM